MSRKLSRHSQTDEEPRRAFHELREGIRAIGVSVDASAASVGATLNRFLDGLDRSEALPAWPPEIAELRALAGAVEADRARLLSEIAAIDERIAALSEAFAADRFGNPANSPRHVADHGDRRSEAGPAETEPDPRLRDDADQNGVIEALRQSVADLNSRIDRSAIALLQKMDRSLLREFRQNEALSALNRLLDFELPLPATRGWAASPDLLLHLYHHITSRRPAVVVELGGGISTLVIAAALAANADGGRVHSLDHDEAFARRTARMLARYGLADTADVHHAPLVPWHPPRPTELGTEWRWYSEPGALEKLTAIDLLVVDGPPLATGRFARYPSVPHFLGRLRQGSVVLLDDARRDDERIAAEEWSRDGRLKLELITLSHVFEKGLAILTDTGPSAAASGPNG